MSWCNVLRLYVSGSRAVYDAENHAADHDGCGDLFLCSAKRLQVVDLYSQQCYLNSVNWCRLRHDQTQKRFWLFQYLGDI